MQICSTQIRCEDDDRRKLGADGRRLDGDDEDECSDDNDERRRLDGHDHDDYGDHFFGPEYLDDSEDLDDNRRRRLDHDWWHQHQSNGRLTTQCVKINSLNSHGGYCGQCVP